MATISPTQVYFWTQADSIRDAFSTISGVTFGIALVTSLVFAITYSCEHYIAPTSKSVALMVVVPAVINSQPIQHDLPELYNYAVEALKEQVQLKPPQPPQPTK